MASEGRKVSFAGEVQTGQHQHLKLSEADGQEGGGEATAIEGAPQRQCQQEQLRKHEDRNIIRGG